MSILFKGWHAIDYGIGTVSLWLCVLRTPWAAERWLLRNQLLAAVIAVDNTFNQGRAICVHSSFANCGSQLFSIAGTVAFRMAVAPVKGFDQRPIVPILDIVVLAVVYLHLDGIAVVVDQEQNNG